MRRSHIDPSRTADLRRAAASAATASMPLLLVPVVRQSTNFSCGAAVFASLAKYYGIGGDTERKAIQLLGTTPADGTTPEAIARALSAAGLLADVREGMSLGDAEAAIAVGSPVVADVTMHGGGHYVIIVAASARVVYVDPSAGLQSLPRRHFDRIWHDTDRDHLGIAVTGLTANVFRDELGRFARSADSAAKSAMARYNAAVAKVPALKKAMDVSKGISKKLYSALEHRYGKPTAIAVLASAQVIGWGAMAGGAAAGVPLYLPGVSIWGTVPAAALAETYLQAKRAYKAVFNVDVQRLALLLVRRVQAEHAKYMKSLQPTVNVEQFYDRAYLRGVARAYLDSKQDPAGLRSYLASFTANRLSPVERDVIAEGVELGLTPAELARELRELAGVAKARARTIARTEVIRSHAEGQLDSYGRLGAGTVRVRAEWSAAGDACPRCADMDGRVFTLAKARGLIPLHPNCRCAWIPA